MLTFLKNHPRLRVLILFLIIIVASIIMLSMCSKNSQTYLRSEVNDKKIEANQKNPIADHNHQKLIAKERQQQIQQAEQSSGSYIEDVFSSSTKEKTDKDIDNSRQEKQMDPVAFYDYKHQQKKADAQKSQTLVKTADNQENQLQIDPKVAQKNFEVILKTWNKSPSMKDEHSELSNSSFSGGMAADGSDLMAMFKAGDILIAVIDTSVNSDQPNTPVLAHVVVGPYKHAKLLGSFVREEDKLVVRFNTLSIDSRAKSISINAYAIDQNTAQTALASDVDHHYLLRYGSLFAASFLQGFGTYFSNAQNNNRWCYTDPITRREVCQGSEVEMSARNAAYSGLGQIGTALSSSMSKQFDKPPTVTLDQGSAIGVLIMQDVNPVKN
ncbi:TrbI/VirB10 family protein [Cysteiniphilum halobium]|uniref:TrbI/VirB10 family protein n=1 Tax=Cysteiniphilum halobium TaxID=2219059 RepID=UPI000E65BF48|nr:TrbI/VirB10 family protein [Cysteiniphilum halobium]